MVAWIRSHFSQNVVGYAFLAGAIFFSGLIFQLQQNRQNQFADVLAAQQDRSCAAIAGTIAFWRTMLVAEELSLTDPTLSNAARNAKLLSRKALILVITRAGGVAKTC